MAQQLINIGGSADDGTGTNWRDCWDIVNDNFTEVYGFQTNNIIIINQESDFPNQTATTITLNAGLCYHLGDLIITSKNFVIEGGSGVCLKSNTGLGLSLVYSGAGNLFTMGAGAAFQLSDIGVSAPLANLFDFNTASTLNTFNFVALDCVGIGTFVAGSTSSVIIDNFALLNVSGNGFDFTGNWSLLSMSRILSQATSASHEFIDMNTATFDDVNITRVEADGPSGSVFIKGATGSANINANRLAIVTICTVSGGMTDLSGITSSDIRWDFQKNSPTADTLEDALSSFNGNVTETTITTINTPVIVNAVWTCVRASKFTCATTGRITSNSERELSGVPIDVNVGLISSGGGAIDVTVYLAKNGSVITDSATTISISGSNQGFVSIPWQESISVNDYYEVFVENNSGTTNIIVESGKLRLR